MHPTSNHPSRALATLVLACCLTACDEGSSGLQQRLIELEAQRDAQSQKVAELQTRLNGLLDKTNTSAAPGTPPPPSEDAGSSSDRAALISTANELGTALAKELSPGVLDTYGQTQFVGFKLKTADGSFTSVLVPFFSKGDGYWECGWSKAEIKAALGNKGASANAAPSPVQSTMAQTPPSVPATTPPKTQIIHVPTAAPPAVVSMKTPDVPDPDALKLQPGESYVTLTDLDGNPQRAIKKADGTLRVIFK